MAKYLFSIEDSRRNEILPPRKNAQFDHFLFDYDLSQSFDSGSAPTEKKSTKFSSIRLSFRIDEAKFVRYLVDDKIRWAVAKYAKEKME